MIFEPEEKRKGISFSGLDPEGRPPEFLGGLHSPAAARAF